jgi:ribosome assembly protein 1
MESSAVSLSYRAVRGNYPCVRSSPPSALNAEQYFHRVFTGDVAQDYLVNLIDTPGHVDFSSEVSTASRLCDGALVLVDAVEGVCTQTLSVLRQVWEERLRPILVINKIDRLITELRLAPIEAHHHLSNLVENVNAIMGSFYASERMEDDLRWREAREKRLAARKESDNQVDVAVGDAKQAEEEDDEFEERDDEDIYFAPEKGDVIFASAIDGWAFRLDQFARIHALRLGISEAKLRRVLWGDFYLDPKAKRVVSRAKLGGRNLKPMFVQFVLENIWAVYDSVVLNPCVIYLSLSNATLTLAYFLPPSSNPDKVTKIVTSLGLKVRPSDLKSKDPRPLLVSIFGQWLPLASSTFRAIVDKVPSPPVAQRTRIPKMLHPDLPYSQAPPEPTGPLERDLYSANASLDSCIVAYVSKMFAIPVADLPQNQRRALTAEEMRARGRASREAAASLAAAGAIPLNQAETKAQERRQQEAESATATAPSEPVDPNAETLIGFSRLYSGTLRIGQELYCVLPKYNASLPPSHPSNAKHLTRVTVDHLYMIMGRELVQVKEVPAGNVFGIGGLEGKVLRNATLCAPGTGRMELTATVGEEKDCLINLAGLNLQSAPIVRVALEPADPGQCDLSFIERSRTDKARSNRATFQACRGLATVESGRSMCRNVGARDRRTRHTHRWRAPSRSQLG